MNDALAGAALGRRQFLGGLALVAGGAALIGPGGLLGALPGAGGVQPFTRAAVAARVGEAFRIVGGAHDGVRLTIAAIAELPGRAAAVPDDQFAARFAAAPGVELASDMYWFATGSFGALPLFVTPLAGPDGQTTGYEALVNRYVPGALAARRAAAGGC